MKIIFPEQQLNTKFNIGERVIWEDGEGKKSTGTIAGISVHDKTIMTYLSSELFKLVPMTYILYTILSDTPHGYYNDYYVASVNEKKLVAIENDSISQSNS